MKNTFFTSNRKALAEKIKFSVAVFSAYASIQQSGDMAAPFLQEANFWYLTGINEPGWRLILEGNNSWLVSPEIDDIHAVFDGTLSAKDAKNISGVDEVINSTEAEELLERLSAESRVYTLGNDPRASHYGFELNPAPVALYEELQKSFKEVKDCRLELARLRAIKKPEEIEKIREAINLTVAAFANVKEKLSSFAYEYEIEAEFNYHFRRSGSEGHAYEPIVASGEHACTLHYNKNSGQLGTNELLLLDIGARVGNYAADVTRTYVIGTPTDRQAQVHKAVETAHKQIIKLIEPGLAVKEYADHVDTIMKQALDSLGLLKKESDYRKYFPHSISHGLGIDVHDSLGEPTKFEPGMVLTVEPGIYIPEEKIGVRIEDDILVTEKGHENLSAHLPTSL